MPKEKEKNYPMKKKSQSGSLFLVVVSELFSARHANLQVIDCPKNFSDDESEKRANHDDEDQTNMPLPFHILMIP